MMFRTRQQYPVCDHPVSSIGSGWAFDSESYGMYLEHVVWISFYTSRTRQERSCLPIYTGPTRLDYPRTRNEASRAILYP